jgi:hypothetical protein
MIAIAHRTIRPKISASRLRSDRIRTVGYSSSRKR